ncbi:DUF4398 domain-containing protein [Nitrosomonas sp.]|uniref:DUF4398 domain-containing protein n=1 Tax=Nitrosomonas sp. TaxID=42353 RepID=UPI00262B5D04|nr:DUF4398 domain-containing protein [Nitrosomonas sp.]
MDKKMIKNFYHIKSRQMTLALSVTVISVIFMAGCASVPAPTEQIAVSRTAVNNALSAGDNEFAPLQLKSAMEKMDAAERAMVDKNYVLARELAEQAQIDAKLAGTLARSTKAQKAADALQEDSRVLRQEIDRQTQ